MRDKYLLEWQQRENVIIPGRLRFVTKSKTVIGLADNSYQALCILFSCFLNFRCEQIKHGE